MKREHLEGRPYRRLNKSSAKNWSDRTQQAMKQQAIREFQTDFAGYSHNFLQLSNTEPDRSFILGYKRLLQKVFEDNIQGRMSLAYSDETAQFSVLMPEVFLYPMISQMSILETTYRYCHVGSWKLPHFHLHVSFYLDKRQDAEMILGKEAISTRWWNGSEHNTNNNDIKQGPLSGGNVEILCDQTFPIILNYNVATNYLMIKYQYVVNTWHQPEDGSNIVLKPISSANFSMKKSLFEKKTSL